jgi:hypothetical protein
MTPGLARRYTPAELAEAVYGRPAHPFLGHDAHPDTCHHVTAPGKVCSKRREEHARDTRAT